MNLGVARRWLWWEVVAAGLVLPWLWGGRVGFTPWLLAGLTGLMGFTTWRLWRRERFGIARGHWIVLAVGVTLLLILAGSLLNPAAEWVERSEGRMFLLPRTFIAWLPATLDRERTVWFGTAWMSVFFSAWLVAVTPWSRRERRRWWGWWGMQGGGLAIVGLWFRATGASAMLGFGEAVNPWFFASFRYHNHWVAFALLALGWSLAWWWSGRERPWRRNDPRALAAVAIGALFLSLPFCHSRSGVLFALVWAVTLAGVVAVTGKGCGSRKAKRRRAWMLGGILGGAVAMLLVSAPALEHRWRGTVEQWEQYQAGEAFDIRLGPAPEATLTLIRQRPLWGWGAGSYFRAFPSVAGDDFRYETWGKERLLRLEFAHCDWLQFPAEIGVIGMALLLGAIGWAWIRGLCRWMRGERREGGEAWIWLSLGSLAVLAGWEFPFGNFAVAALAGWTLALQAAPWASISTEDASEERARSGR